MRLMELPCKWRLWTRHVDTSIRWHVGLRRGRTGHIRRCVLTEASASANDYIVSLGIFGTLFGLFLMHRKQRDQDRGKRMQYWREQVCLTRRLLVPLHFLHVFYRMLSTKTFYKCDSLLVRRSFPFPATETVPGVPCTVVTVLFQTKLPFCKMQLRLQSQACGTI